MPFQKHYDLPLPVTHNPCIHLRSKAIYVTGQLRNPQHPDEEGSQYCWCNLTQHVLGPDQKDVDTRNCCPGRDCYRESY
jgi:hypothetical protein